MMFCVLRSCSARITFCSIGYSSKELCTSSALYVLSWVCVNCREDSLLPLRLIFRPFSFASLILKDANGPDGRQFVPLSVYFCASRGPGELLVHTRSLGQKRNGGTSGARSVSGFGFNDL